MTSNELGALQGQNLNLENTKAPRTENRRSLKILVLVIWVGGQVVLSYIFGGIPRFLVSIGAGYNSKDAPLLLAVYCLTYLCLSLIIFTPIIKLIQLSWKKALLATLLSSLVLLPTSFFLMYQIQSYKVLEKFKVQEQTAEEEIYKYHGTVEFTNIAEELKSEVSCTSPRCTKNENYKFLAVSLDMKTPHEGIYSIFMHLNHEETSYSDTFVLVNADWETNEIHLKPGTHHLEFILPTNKLFEKKATGPYNISLYVRLEDEELKKAQEENPLILPYSLYGEQDFYQTKAYSLSEFYFKVKKDKLRYISQETILNPTTDKLGTVEINCQILEPGNYELFTVFEISLNIQPYIYHTSSTQRKELSQGSQKIEIPVPQVIVSGQKISPAQISKIEVTQIHYCSYQNSSPCYEESLPLL